MKNLLGALLKAQQEFPALVKDASNPAFRSRYATLGAVQEAAFPILAKHGIVVLQSVRSDFADDARLVVYIGATMFHVESGEQVQQEVGMIPAKQDPQGVGSAITYGRRYLLMTMLGLVPDDDDGNAASVGSQSGKPSTSWKREPVKAIVPPRTQEDAAPRNNDDWHLSTQDDPIDAPTLQQLHIRGREVRGAAWEEGHHRAAKWASGGRTESTKELTLGEARMILDLLNKEAKKKQEAA